MLAKSPTSVAERLVDRGTRRPESVGEDVDRHPAKREGRKDVPLRPAQRVECLTDRARKIVAVERACCLPLPPAELSQLGRGLLKRELRRPGAEAARTAVFVKAREHLRQGGGSCCTREPVEFGGAGGEGATPARDLEAARVQESLEAREGIGASCRGCRVGRSTSRRASSSTRPSLASRSADATGAVTPGAGDSFAAGRLYGFGRRRMGRGRGFHSSCFLPSPAAISSRATLSTTRSDVVCLDNVHLHLLGSGSPMTKWDALWAPAPNWGRSGPQPCRQSRVCRAVPNGPAAGASRAPTQMGS